MRVLSLFFLLVLVFVEIGGSRPAEAAPVPIFPIPIHLKASESLYDTGAVQIELLENGVLQLSEIDFSKGEDFKSVKKTMIPTIAAWRTFIRECDEIGLWRWKESYVELGVLDGLEWSVEVAFEDEKGEMVRSVKSRGVNQFPFGRSTSEERSEEYKAFWEAVKKLMDVPGWDIETMLFD